MKLIFHKDILKLTDLYILPIYCEPKVEATEVGAALAADSPLRPRRQNRRFECVVEILWQHRL